MTEAAEIGTRKVITEHSTIGIVITTDGTISDIPREDYLEAEERVIRELQELGKPFIVLLNSAEPRSDRAQAIAKDVASRYEVRCMPVNCLELGGGRMWRRSSRPCCMSFPCRSWISTCRPGWMHCLRTTPSRRDSTTPSAGEQASSTISGRWRGVIAALGASENISEAKITSIDTGHRRGCRTAGAATGTLLQDPL